MKRALTPWRIDTQECEVFGGDDSIATPDELNAALTFLPQVLERLRVDPEAGVSTVGTSALSLSSHQFDHVIGGRVVPGLTLIYDLIPEEGRVVLRRIQLLSALDTETEQPIRVVGVVATGDTYEEKIASMVGKKVLGKKVAVAIENYDTREDDFPVTLLNKPLFFEVFLGRDGDE